jgi:hypothetical protein
MSSHVLETAPPSPGVTDGIATSCTIALPTTAIHVPASVFTLAGFRAWAKSDESPPHACLTFVDQEVIVDMSGEELRVHGLVKSAVCTRLYPVAIAEVGGLFYIDGALITNETANVSNIPDGVFVTYESLEVGRVRTVASEQRPQELQELVGSPDWVLEVVSHTSVHKDTFLLRQAYHRAQIPEYWLIDARGEAIDFQILVHKPNGYEPAPQRGGWQRSPLFRHRFRLLREEGRFGFWQFTLEVKPAR